jgi:hypothetical protein
MSSHQFQSRAAALALLRESGGGESLMEELASRPPIQVSFELLAHRTVVWAGPERVSLPFTAPDDNDLGGVVLALSGAEKDTRPPRPRFQPFLRSFAISGLSTLYFAGGSVAESVFASLLGVFVLVFVVANAHKRAPQEARLARFLAGAGVAAAARLLTVLVGTDTALGALCSHNVAIGALWEIYGGVALVQAIADLSLRGAVSAVMGQVPTALGIVVASALAPGADHPFACAADPAPHPLSVGQSAAIWHAALFLALSLSSLRIQRFLSHPETPTVVAVASLAWGLSVAQPSALISSLPHVHTTLIPILVASALARFTIRSEAVAHISAIFVWEAFAPGRQLLDALTLVIAGDHRGLEMFSSASIEATAIAAAVIAAATIFKRRQS